MDPNARIARWLDTLPDARRIALAAGYADGLAGDGLYVWHADEERAAPIPPMLTPQIVDDDELDAFSRDARPIVSATAKLATKLLRDAPERFEGFVPLEWEALRNRPNSLADVATARVDGFLAAGGPVALEVNATIPAMQGYSDLILHRWLRTVAAERGWTPEAADELVRDAGSNTADLLATLVDGARRRGAPETPSILIVSRRGDSQTGELRHYERVFRAAGHDALHVPADEVTLDDEGRVRARGRRWDLVYRHVFARRVEPGTPLARLLADPGPNVVLNPINGPLEVKAVLASLHEAADDPASGLDDVERDAVRRRVPWTRPLRPGPATFLDGERVSDLVAAVTASRDRLVVKKSWDYGGKGVHLGPETEDWARVVAAAAADPSPWVVQALVPPTRARHLVVERDGSGVRTVWKEPYVDLDVYTSTFGPRPTGGVCRASASAVVNIVRGGGLAPLVRRSIVERLFPPPEGLGGQGVK